MSRHNSRSRTNANNAPFKTFISFTSQWRRESRRTTLHLIKQQDWRVSYHPHDLIPHSFGVRVFWRRKQENWNLPLPNKIDVNKLEIEPNKFFASTSIQVYIPTVVRTIHEVHISTTVYQALKSQRGGALHYIRCNF